jgi:hypothetical protein
MSVVERLRGNKAAAKDGGDLAARLEALRPEHDEGLARARKAEAESLERFEQAEGDGGRLRTKGEDAESALGSARLRLAEGTGSVAEVKAAKLAAEDLRDRIEGQEGLIRVLGVKVADLREATRQAEEAAFARSREQILTLVRANAQARAHVYERGESLVADAGMLLRALDSACPRLPILSNGRIVGETREGWDQRWPVLLGTAGDEHNCAIRCQSVFHHDPHESGGGALARWRELAAEAGFLPPTDALKEKRERATREQAEALVRGATRDKATRAHLAEVFRPGEDE